MDGTQECTKCNHALYQIMVEDRNGRARSVFWCFVHKENKINLDDMVSMFAEMMGDVSGAGFA